MKRIVAIAILACAACATVADLEVNRTDGGGARAEGKDDPPNGGGGSDGGANDGGGAANDSAVAPDTGPSAFACQCEAGIACCVRASSAPACDPACTGQGSFALGCVRSDVDGRDCCWSGPDAGVATTAFAPGCNDKKPAACLGNDDCVAYGGTCTTLSCKGVAMGVCATAAPSWFVCPP